MEPDLASEGKAMRRLMFFTGGVLCGVMIGAAVALLLAPASGDSMREDARRRFDEMMVEAQLAADKRRRELETQLAEMTTPPPETAIKPV
jgi:gas vesicle protein